MKYRDAWVIGPNGGLVAAWVVEPDMAMDDNKWITVHPNGANNKGRPALIDGETGTIIAGMGGKFKGQNIARVHKKARMQKIAEGTKKKIAAIGVLRRYVYGTPTEIKKLREICKKVDEAELKYGEDSPEVNAIFDKLDMEGFRRTRAETRKKYTEAANAAIEVFKDMPYEGRLKVLNEMEALIKKEKERILPMKAYRTPGNSFKKINSSNAAEYVRMLSRLQTKLVYAANSDGYTFNKISLYTDGKNE